MSNLSLSNYEKNDEQSKENSLKKELQKEMEKLLSSAEGTAALSKLLDLDLSATFTDFSTEQEVIQKERRKRTKKLKIVPPPFILRVRCVCNLCGSTTFEYFKMRFSEERNGFISRKVEETKISAVSHVLGSLLHLDLKNPNLPNPSTLLLKTVDLQDSIVSGWASPTFETSTTPRVVDRTTEFPAQNIREVVQNCRLCYDSLIKRPKEDLVKILIGRSNKAQETMEFVKLLARMHAEQN